VSELIAEAYSPSDWDNSTRAFLAGIKRFRELRDDSSWDHQKLERADMGDGTYVTNVYAVKWPEPTRIKP
jgi:hypothetical protein